MYRGLYRNFNNSFKTMMMMKENYNKANELYQQCLLDKSVYVPNPHDWLLFQLHMRELWECYKAKCETISFCRDILLTNSYAKYMSFMYDTYPSNFSDKIKEYINLTTKDMRMFQPSISGLVTEIARIIYRC